VIGNAFLVVVLDTDDKDEDDDDDEDDEGLALLLGTARVGGTMTGVELSTSLASSSRKVLQAATHSYIFATMTS
jgi:hypothetical protein